MNIFILRDSTIRDYLDRLLGDWFLLIVGFIVAGILAGVLLL